MHIDIRNAIPEDAEALRNIYAYYVENTAISFEYTAPTVTEFKCRIENTLKKYPYIVAETGDHIVGYAYASAFRPRSAYAHCCEISIYIGKDERRCGTGSLLLAELEGKLREMGIHNLYTCISVPTGNDDHVDFASRDFHQHMGYTVVGQFHGCGNKFGNLYDMIFMEKLI